MNEQMIIWIMINTIQLMAPTASPLSIVSVYTSNKERMFGVHTSYPDSTMIASDLHGTITECLLDIIAKLARKGIPKTERTLQMEFDLALNKINEREKINEVITYGPTEESA